MFEMLSVRLLCFRSMFTPFSRPEPPYCMTLYIADAKS